MKVLSCVTIGEYFFSMKVSTRVDPWRRHFLSKKIRNCKMLRQEDVVFSKVVWYLLVCWSQIAIGTKSVQCNVQSPNLENSIVLDRKVTKFWFNKRPPLVLLTQWFKCYYPRQSKWAHHNSGLNSLPKVTLVNKFLIRNSS